MYPALIPSMLGLLTDERSPWTNLVRKVIMSTLLSASRKNKKNYPNDCQNLFPRAAGLSAARSAKKAAVRIGLDVFWRGLIESEKDVNCIPVAYVCYVPTGTYPGSESFRFSKNRARVSRQPRPTERFHRGPRAGQRRKGLSDVRR